MSDTERLAAICTGASPRCGLVFGAYKNRHMCGKPLAHVGRHRCGTCGTEKHNDMPPVISPPARIFLAGPMTGLPSYNFPAFMRTANVLMEQGYSVWNPAERAMNLDNFNPMTDKAKPLRHYLRRSMDALYSVSHPIDAVAVMHGWEISNGTRLEMWAALSCGILVIDAVNLTEINMTNFVGVAPLEDISNVCKLLKCNASEIFGNVRNLMAGIIPEQLAPVDTVSAAHVKNVCEILRCAPEDIERNLKGITNVLGIIGISGTSRERLRALRETLWTMKLEDPALSLDALNALDEAAIAISAAEFDLFKAERTHAV